MVKRKSNLPWPPYQLVALPITPATARDCHHEFLVKTYTGGDTIGVLRLLDETMELWVRGRRFATCNTMLDVMLECEKASLIEVARG